MREVPSVIGPFGRGSPFGQGTCLRHAPAVKVLSESLLREGGQLSVPVLGDVAICKLFVSLWVTIEVRFHAKTLPKPHN